MYRDLDTWQHESYVWDAGRLVEVVRSVDMGGGDDPYAWLQRLSWSGDRLLRCDEHRITDPYWPAESLAARVARELDDVPDLALAVLNYDDAGAFSLAGLDLAALEDMGGIEEVENWSMVPHWPRVISIDLSTAARPVPGIDVGAYAEEVVQLAAAEHCRPDRLRARVPPLIAAIPVAADDPDAPARTALGRWQSACVVRQQLLDAQAKTDAQRLQRRRDRATRRQPPGAEHS